MATGTVKWFDPRKGYGFILREGDSDLYVHHTGIVCEGFRTLFEGDVVEFEIAPAHEGHEGEQAVNVTLIEAGERRSKRDAKRAAKAAAASSEAEV